MSDHLDIADAQGLWDWLGDNHAQAASIWLVTFKKAVPDKYVSRDEVLDALVAHGWVDGRRMVVDDLRTKQLIAPRKQPGWAESYCRRAERLEAEGRMHPSGQAAVVRAKAGGQWRATPQVDALVIPPDLAEALKAHAPADVIFPDMAPSYRRNVLRWLSRAKKPETRARRAAQIAQLAAEKRKVPQN
ncbi:MAG: YdeI/OmpD-associated family protein [Rhodobacteraceae bacterium]|nr:YdeI/OmpD-associated family protein [Paracoccaceae bacterium]